MDRILSRHHYCTGGWCSGKKAYS